MSLLSFFKRNRPAPVPVTASSRGSEALDGYYAWRQKKDADSFCYAPQTSLYFHRTGKVFLCCHNDDYSIGSYPENSIKEMWEGERMKQMKARQKKDDLSAGCQVCKADLDSCSFHSVAAGFFDTLPINPEYPTMMEFQLSNTCNLECTMCNGLLSSSIRKNREKLPPIRSKYDRRFVEGLKDFIPHLLHTRFSGGEPFLIPIYYEIWEQIIEHNPDCLIVIQTNGTVLTPRVKELMQRGRFEIGVSLDSLDAKIYEEIRPNSEFSAVMENIAWFREYCREKGTIFRLAACVMRNNWHEMPEFLKLANESDAVLSFHKVWNPRELALHPLPHEKLTEIMEFLASFDLNAQNSREEENLRTYRSTQNQIEVWRDAALRFDRLKQKWAGATIEELKVGLYAGVEVFLESKEDMSPDERHSNYQTFTTKLDSLMRRIEDTERQRIALLRTMDAPVEFVLWKTINDSEDELLQKVQKLIDG